MKIKLLEEPVEGGGREQIIRQFIAYFSLKTRRDDLMST